MCVHYSIYADKIRTFCYTALACGGVCILAAKIKNKAQKLTLLCFINLLINTIFMAAPYQISGQDMWRSFCAIKDAESLAHTMEEAENQAADWYRMDRKGTTRGESLIQGYRGCTAYYSIMNGNIWKFYDAMMISPGICGAVHCLIGLDDRMALETLLSVKHAERDKALEADENMLPFGFEYKVAVSEEAFSQMHPVEKQGVMLDRIVLEDIAGDDGDGMQTAVEELPCTIEYRNIERQGNTLIPQEDAQIVIRFNEELPNAEDGEVYLYFQDFQSHRDGGSQSIRVGDKELYINNPESVYSTGQKDYLVKVDAGDIAVQLPEDNFFTLGSIEAYLYPLPGQENPLWH